MRSSVFGRGRTFLATLALAGLPACIPAFWNADPSDESAGTLTKPPAGPTPRTGRPPSVPVPPTPPTPLWAGPRLSHLAEKVIPSGSGFIVLGPFATYRTGGTTHPGRRLLRIDAFGRRDVDFDTQINNAGTMASQQLVADSHGGYLVAFWNGTYTSLLRLGANGELLRTSLPSASSLQRSWNIQEVAGYPVLYSGSAIRFLSPNFVDLNAFTGSPGAPIHAVLPVGKARRRVLMASLGNGAADFGAGLTGALNHLQIAPNGSLSAFGTNPDVTSTSARSIVMGLDDFAYAAFNQHDALFPLAATDLFNITRLGDIFWAGMMHEDAYIAKFGVNPGLDHDSDWQPRLIPAYDSSQFTAVGNPGVLDAMEPGGTFDPGQTPSAADSAVLATEAHPCGADQNGNFYFFGNFAQITDPAGQLQTVAPGQLYRLNRYGKLTRTFEFYRGTDLAALTGCAINAAGRIAVIGDFDAYSQEGTGRIAVKYLAVLAQDGTLVDPTSSAQLGLSVVNGIAVTPQESMVATAPYASATVAWTPDPGADSYEVVLYSLSPSPPATVVLSSAHPYISLGDLGYSRAFSVLVRSVRGTTRGPADTLLTFSTAAAPGGTATVNTPQPVWISEGSVNP